MTISSDAEEIVQEIWRDQLKVENLEPGDDFFALGGQSLDAVSVVSRVRDALGVDVRLADMFNGRTLPAFLDRIAVANKLDAKVEPRPQRISRNAAPPTSIEQAKILELLDHSPTPLSVHFAFRVSGALDPHRLQAALDLVTAQHELLRTTFAATADGQRHQLVSPEARLTIRRVTVPAPQQQDQLATLLQEEIARPLDRSVAPLARCALFALSSTDHVLLFVLDHIITDGRSIGVFLEDLTAAYHGLADDPSFRLPTQSYDFADWAAWQRQLLTSRYVAELRTYWKDRLGPSPAVLSTRFPHYTLTVQGRPAGHRVQVPAPSVSTLHHIAHELQVTPFALLLSGLLVALSQRTGQMSFCVGTTLANRSHPAFERVFGPISHDAYIKVELPAPASVTTAAGEVQKSVQATIDHGQLPNTLLWEEIWPGMDEEAVNAPGLYVVLNQIWVDSLRLTGASVEPLPTSPQMPMPGLECTAYGNATQLALNFGYLEGSLPELVVRELAHESLNAVLDAGREHRTSQVVS